MFEPILNDPKVVQDHRLQVRILRFSQGFANSFYNGNFIMKTGYTGNSNINKGRVDFVLVLAPF